MNYRYTVKEVDILVLSFSCGVERTILFLLCYKHFTNRVIIRLRLNKRGSDTEYREGENGKRNVSIKRIIFDIVSTHYHVRFYYKLFTSSLCTCMEFLRDLR